MKLKQVFAEKNIIVQILFIVIFLQFVSTLQTNKPRFFCGPVVSQFGLFKISVLCDSSHYLLAAQNPGRLLNYSIDPNYYGSPLQDRPLAPLLAYLLSLILKKIPGLDYYVNYTGKDNILMSYSFSVYIAYLILNLAILYFTVILTLDLMKSKPKPLRLIIVMYLSFNQLTQNYFWIPNTVLMNNLFAVLLFKYFHNFDLNKKNAFYKYIFSFTILSMYYPIFIFGVLVILLFDLTMKTYSKTFFMTTATISFFYFYVTILNYFGTYENNPGQAGYFSWLLDFRSFNDLVHSVRLNIMSLLVSFSILQILFFVWVLFTGRLKRRFLCVFLLYLGYVFSLGVFDYRYNVGLTTFLFLSYLSSNNSIENKATKIITYGASFSYLLYAFLAVGTTY
jgi:hypothetical protein